MNIEISYLGVAIASVASFIIGMLWYSQALFGKAWMKYTGMNKESLTPDQKSKMMWSMILNLTATLVLVYVLAHVMGAYAKLSMETTGTVNLVSTGLQSAFWLWLGFVATLSLNSVLWERRPWGLYFINVLCVLVQMLVSGVILAYV